MNTTTNEVVAYRLMGASPGSICGKDILGTYYVSEHGSASAALTAARAAGERWERAHIGWTTVIHERTSADSEREEAKLDRRAEPRRRSPSYVRRQERRVAARRAS